jgi:hypothetical protein
MPGFSFTTTVAPHSSQNAFPSCTSSLSGIGSSSVRPTHGDLNVDTRLSARNYIDTVGTGIGGWYYLSVREAQYTQNVMTNIEYMGFR